MPGIQLPLIDQIALAGNTATANLTSLPVRDGVVVTENVILAQAIESRGDQPVMRILTSGMTGNGRPNWLYALGLPSDLTLFQTNFLDIRQFPGLATDSMQRFVASGRAFPGCFNPNAIVYIQVIGGRSADPLSLLALQGNQQHPLHYAIAVESIADLMA